MAYTFLTGGARSGKSAAAERMARASRGPVVVVATGEPLDDEMAERIAEHREARDRDWITVEEPRALADAVSAMYADRFVIVDCLTLWVANVLDSGPDGRILAEAGRTAYLLSRRPGGGVVISNEVGDGIVPADPVSRRYRDLLGRVNGRFAAQADASYLLVAGRALLLEPTPW